MKEGRQVARKDSRSAAAAGPERTPQQETAPQTLESAQAFDWSFRDHGLLPPSPPAAGGGSRGVSSGALSEEGQPLDPGSRQFFEPRFGFDFSQVRLHTSHRAEHDARSLQARAFTSGNHIVFGAGQFAPATRQGRVLLAHELAHVVQQRERSGDPSVITPHDSPSEHEARRAAVTVLHAGRSGALNAVPTGISRDDWRPLGPIPDLANMGYNDIFNAAGPGFAQAVWDLSSLETGSPDVSAFEKLPAHRALKVLDLEQFAKGKGCEPWFQQLRNATIAPSFTLDDPYTSKATSFPIQAFFFKGTSDRKALIIGGVHRKSEPQGVAVVEKLRALLTARAAALNPQFFTVILVPALFDLTQYAGISNPEDRWIKGGMGFTKKGKLQTDRAVEPNRNFPLPGEDLEAAWLRGRGSPTDPELVFSDPKKPGTTRPAKDKDKKGFQGTSIRMLPETRALISLIETFQPERIASVHAHGVEKGKRRPGNDPGIFVDPRLDPTQEAEDDRLTTAMVQEGQSRLTNAPIKDAENDQVFQGNQPGKSKATVRYAQSAAHAEGNSLGDWAPVAVTKGAGARPGITTVTIEVPGWDLAAKSTQLDKVEALDADLLNEIFLEDPRKAVPATTPKKP
jgi:hypothetical protein